MLDALAHLLFARAERENPRLRLLHRGLRALAPGFDLLIVLRRDQLLGHKLPVAGGCGGGIVVVGPGGPERRLGLLQEAPDFIEARDGLMHRSPIPVHLGPEFALLHHDQRRARLDQIAFADPNLEHVGLHLAGHQRLRLGPDGAYRLERFPHGLTSDGLDTDTARYGRL